MTTAQNPAPRGPRRPLRVPSLRLGWAYREDHSETPCPVSFRPLPLWIPLAVVAFGMSVFAVALLEALLRSFRERP